MLLQVKRIISSAQRQRNISHILKMRPLVKTLRLRYFNIIIPFTFTQFRMPFRDRDLKTNTFLTRFLFLLRATEKY